MTRRSSRGRRLAGPCVVLAILALVTGCRGGGGSVEAASSTSLASTTEPASTTTAGASSVTTGRATVPVPSTPTEPAVAVLADGTYPVYLAGVSVSRRTITVDVVQVLERTSPEAATVCPDIASGDIDGYCIKNASLRLRTLPVPPSASLRVLSGSDLHPVDLAGLAAARRPQRTANFYEIAVSGGRVTSAKELYRA